MNYSNLFTFDIKVFIPEIFLSLQILVVLLYGLFLSTSKKYNNPIISKHIYFFLVYSLILTFFLIANNPVEDAIIFQKTYIQDNLGKTCKLLIVIFTICCLVLSQKKIEQLKLNNYEYFLCMLFSVFALVLLSSSYDLIGAYLAIEMQALAFYLLACIKKSSLFSTEAGLKYFILGAFSSGLLLYGFSIVYGISGTTNVLDIKDFLLYEDCAESDMLKLCVYFLTAAFFFKISAFPFHMWSPDVYEGSPTSSSTFFAIVPKIALFSFILRFYIMGIPSLSDSWNSLFLFSGVGCIIYSSLVAFKQKSLKRLLAYSAIGHIGFLLLPLSIYKNIEFAECSLFYLLSYILGSLPAWGILLVCTHGREYSQNSITILAGLFNACPLISLISAFSFFSLAGIPPLIGFYAKFFVFFVLLQSSYIFLSFLLLGTSVLSAYYYINLVKTIFVEKKKKWQLYFFFKKENSILLCLFFFLLIFFIFNPTFILLLSQYISNSLVPINYFLTDNSALQTYLQKLSYSYVGNPSKWDLILAWLKSGGSYVLAGFSGFFCMLWSKCDPLHIVVCYLTFIFFLSDVRNISEIFFWEKTRWEFVVRHIKDFIIFLGVLLSYIGVMYFIMNNPIETIRLYFQEHPVILFFSILPVLYAFDDETEKYRLEKKKQKEEEEQKQKQNYTA